MVTRTVLVPVDGTPAGRRVVEAAFLAAQGNGGHVVGLFVIPRAGMLTAEAIASSRSSMGVASEDIRAALYEAEQEGGIAVQAARHSFHDVAEAAEAEILERPPNPGHLTASFKVIAATGPNTLAEQGRVFDLVVVRQPRDDADHSLRKTLRSVLFEAGRPILVAPDRPLPSLGKRLLIAWSRSALSARAAAISRNFFLGAEEVGILSVKDKSASGPTAYDLANYVGWHGIDATVIDAELGKKRLGEVMLEEADRFGADLLVMGAYSHSTFRESLTGGVTNYVLSHADLPIVMTH